MRMVMVVRMIVVMWVVMVMGMIMIVWMVMIVRMIVVMGVVMVMRMVMIVRMIMAVVVHELALFHAVDQHPEMGSANSAFFGMLRTHRDTRNADFVQFPNKSFFVIHQLQQGRAEHISGRAHSAVYKQSFHLIAACCIPSEHTMFPPF